MNVFADMLASFSLRTALSVAAGIGALLIVVWMWAGWVWRRAVDAARFRVALRRRPGMIMVLVVREARCGGETVTVQAGRTATVAPGDPDALRRALDDADVVAAALNARLDELLNVGPPRPGVEPGRPS